jgi:hypothetical protein
MFMTMGAFWTSSPTFRYRTSAVFQPCFIGATQVRPSQCGAEPGRGDTNRPSGSPRTNRRSTSERPREAPAASVETSLRPQKR